MSDPNADPTPEQLAEWWTADLASALKWAEGRLVRAKQLGDVEIRQHLGNLVKAARTLSTARAEVATLRAEYDLVPKGSAALWRDLARRADGGDPGAAMQLVGAVLAALEDLG
jgi:hypothetical protein